MNFNYYYGNQAEQFSFIKIPKVMITDATFSDLSLPAKVLYGLLLDRMSLSMKNRWFDSENRVYIIYQIADIQEDLGISKKKAIDLLNTLEKFGLVEKKRRGLGMPSILYVKNFIVDVDNSFVDASRGGRKDTSGSMQNGTSRSVESDWKRNDKKEKEGEYRALQCINTDVSEKNETTILRNAKSDTSRGIQSDTSRGVKNDTSRGVKWIPQEVPKTEPLINKTNSNNTYLNQSTSNLISDNDVIRWERSSTEIEQYKEMILANIEYDVLLQAHKNEKELIDEIVELILEVVVCKGEEIVIAKNVYPREIVRSRFLKLNFSHVEYVLNCIQKNTTKVKNIKKYMLAVLFNASGTIESYYVAEVNHDFPQFVKKVETSTF